MKNPMTPEQQCQAIMDEKLGFDIEIRPLVAERWLRKVYLGNFNFRDNEYRRKPEPFTAYVNEYENNDFKLFKTLGEALKYKGPFYIRTTRLVSDPTWELPAPKETNPWRYIVPGKWPECKPGDAVILGWANGDTTTTTAYCINWKNPDAVKWKYAED